ncbi:MAG TPA: UPF0182 family protein [Dehalococcoidia bacterium]|nr:UPF0182 family protein [Dehalococcoidia bacterium]
MTRSGPQIGPLGPPPPVFRFRRRGVRGPGRRWRWLIAIAATLLVLFILLNIGVGIYTSWLWFESVGYRSVYATRLTTRVWLFFAGLAVFLAIFLPNLFLARRLAPATDDPDFEWSDEVREFAEGLSMATIGRITTIAFLAAGLLIGLIFASTAAGHWDEILLFLHSQSFGMKDPQFHRDLGFYVFQLPVYRLASDWLLGAIIVTIIGTAAVYVARAAIYGFRLDAPRPIARQIFSVDVPRPIKLHLSLLVVALLVLFAGRYYLDTFELVYSTRGVDLGAFYTDVHAALPLLYALMAVAGLVALVVVVSVFRRGVALPVGGVILWIVVAIVGQFYPAIVQNFVVQPNEISKEQQYLARNIDMTRYAYGLDQIDERAFPATAQATAAEVAANQDTINNVRLWDPAPLQAALQQIQTIRPLFQFLDVDVDRYTLSGKEQQVMLSARELNPARLPANAQTWVNSRLQFTHGYGYTVAAVNEIQSDGTPKLLVSDIPLHGVITTDHPEIYFGEQADHYIIVDGTEPEFTPAAGGANVQTKFQGKGGVSVGSFFRRALYAWKFKDRNILLSGAITGNSRIIYDRNIQQRIHDVAPFLQLDADPYMVVDQGNVYWMQDAYTTTDTIPYSHRTGGVNYIRNSVKVVVNAYSGETTFYAIQPDEPILKAYSAVFPTLFKPIDQMPAGLRQHIRYPEDLFRLQTQVYLRYHIRDARAFYQQEDQWDIPTEIFNNTDQQIRPYYVIARLPGEQKEEFMLILPFVPRSRTNAIAWLAARSDGANYGKLVAFRFPSSESVPGPTQVERRIDSDGRVSQQLTLWNQSGSTVIRGNLLMIPIGNANMFFEPLYLAATGGGNTIPQLKRVVVVNGDNIAMEPTLSRAIDVLFGRAQPSGLDVSGAAPAAPTGTPAAGGTATSLATSAPAPTPAAPALTPVAGDTAASLAAQAQASYDRAQTLLRNGDFAGYGQEIARLKQILDRLQQLVGTPVPTP